MIRSLLFILIVVCSFNIYAQTDYALSGMMAKHNNLPLDKYGALLLGDTCTFYVVGKFGQKVVPDVCKWDFEIEVKQGSYLKEENVVSINYGIKIDSLLFGRNVLGFEYKRYNVENDSSAYYLGRVVFEGEYQGQKIKLDREFYINLLPSLPTVKVLDITWSNYDEKWNIYDDGYMKVRIHSFNSKYISVLERSIYGVHSFYYHFEPNVDADNGIGVLEFYDGDRYLTFSAVNFSGTVQGKDTLWISKAVTSILDVKMDNVPFYPNPVKAMLCVQEDMEGIFPLSIYDSQGRIVKYIAVPVVSIDVSNLMSGIYFVSYRELHSRKMATFKMIKENNY